MTNDNTPYETIDLALYNNVSANLFNHLITEINKRLGSGAAVESTLEFVFDSLSLIIPFDRIGIALLDENEQRLRLSWVQSKVGVKHLRVNYAAPLSESLREVFLSGRSRILNNLEQYWKDHPNSISTKLILKDGIRSSLTCPLRADNKVIGVVFFSSCKANTYRDQHNEIFSSIANELAVVVEQARLRNFFHTSKAKESAASKLLHDLKSPLGVMQGFIDLAKGEHWYNDLPKDGKETFEVLNRNAEYMSSLLTDLAELRWLSLDAKLEMKEVNLERFLNEVASDGKMLARKKDINFQWRAGHRLPESAFFCEPKLRRVLINLFSNAVKFSHRKSKIIFSVDIEENNLIFSISDEGVGIDEKEFSKLFKEFGQASSAPTEGEMSTGLGLAIVKTIVEQHGGTVSMSSKPGYGSTFVCKIPLTTSYMH